MTDNEPTQSPPRGAAGAQERFVRLARERVMPLLKQAADALAARGCGATARLHEVDGRLVAQLEAMPPGLPAGRRPPLLRIAAARQGKRPNMGGARDRLLLIEYTGTFPSVGPGGGFGAEVDYDTVNPNQLEEKVSAFVSLASGA